MKEKCVVAQNKIKFDFFLPLRIFVNSYNHNVARQNLKAHPQLAVFAFDHIGLRINLDGRHEKRTLDLIRNYLESVISGMDRTAALDIGANIGNHSVYFSDLFAEVYAFEPNPRTFSLLKFNSEQACYKKILGVFILA
jgi:hypothetical protein